MVTGAVVVAAGAGMGCGETTISGLGGVVRGNVVVTVVGGCVVDATDFEASGFDAPEGIGADGGGTEGMVAGADGGGTEGMVAGADVSGAEGLVVDGAGADGRGIPEPDGMDGSVVDVRCEIDGCATEGCVTDGCGGVTDAVIGLGAGTCITSPGAMRIHAGPRSVAPLA